MRRKLVRLFPWVSVLGLVAANAVFGFTAGTDPSLVGWWKFDEGAGSVANDSSGNGNTGTIFGNPQWVPGKIGGALSFDGVGDYINCGNGASLSVRDGITLAVWVKTPGMTTTWTAFISKGDTGQSFRLGRDNVGTACHFGLNLPTVSGNPWFSGTTSVSDNEWHHVAGTYDGTRMVLWVDDVQDGSLAYTGQIAVSTTNVLISENESATGRYMTGLMDDVRMYNRGLTAGEIAILMKGYTTPIAVEPSPTAGATDVPRDAAMRWTPGTAAKTHDVYLGTAFDDVNSASRTNPAGLLVSQDQATATYAPPGPLAFAQTYYWRVDEVNAPPDSTIFKGETWNFTAETYGYAVKPIKATASSSMASTMGPDKTIDGSGLDALDQHSTSATQMWTSKKGQSPIWIQYEFDKVYKLYQMWVWNSNQAVEDIIGFGAADVVIETSLDGTTWVPLAEEEFAQATGEPNYVHNTTVDFAGVQAKYVKLTIHSNWAGGTKQAGLSEVRFFYKPVKAYGPTPASGATGVALNATLNWRPGREAVQHQVSLGTDPNDPIWIKTVTPHSFGLGSVGLEYGRTYYWKVNEVNDAASPNLWEGDMWSFATADYAVVDEFDEYDDTCQRIFFSWQDGIGHSGSEACSVAPFGGNGTGSTVGNASPPFAEQTIVHSGSKSMPLGYDNTGSASSEAVLTFDPPQDWTRGGVKTLVLYFYGIPTNTGGPVYVKINSTQVVYDGRADDIARRRWTQWNIDLKSTGANLQSVKTLTLGVSGAGGKGIVYIDDIRLYRSAPAIAQPVVPSTAGLIGYYAMENNVQDGSGSGNNGTLVGSPLYVQGPAGYGTGIQFNGSDSCVDLGKKTVFNPAGSLSISVWANITTWTTDWGHVMVGNRGEDSVGWQLRRHNSNKICFTTRGAGQDDMPSRVDAPLGEWVHIAAVYDNAGNTKRIYINGGEDTVVTTNAATTIAAASHNVYIGARAVAANTGQEGFFGGILDEVRIYTRALSAGEVMYLSNPTPGK